MADSHIKQLAALTDEIVACRMCTRLVDWREKIGDEKRASYRDWDYWAKPVPSFGDPDASLVLLGLAPAAHGGNRTGRVFTGDPSASFLTAAMHQAGLANQPTSEHRDDGLALTGAYVIYRFGPSLPMMVASYHPSPRNTNTGVLSMDALVKVLKQAKDLSLS